MTINKIEERKPEAIPQPQFTSPPPENRWDELRAAFNPPAAKETESFSQAAKELEYDAELEYELNGLDLWEAQSDYEIAKEYDDPSLMRNMTLSEYEGDYEAPTSTLTSSGYTQYLSERRADPIEILEEIARGRTMPYDKCTPEEAQDAMHHIDECDVPITHRTEYARRVLGWTEREL